MMELRIEKSSPSVNGLKIWVKGSLELKFIGSELDEWR